MLIDGIGVGASSFLAATFFYFASTNSDETPKLNILYTVVTG
jgi:hypothetical protein